MYPMKYWVCDNYLCDVDSNAATGVLTVFLMPAPGLTLWWFPGFTLGSEHGPLSLSGLTIPPPAPVI